MKNKAALRIALIAMLAALVCVTTIMIQLPVPATGGYINLGDAFVIASAYLLGGIWGGVAAGTGSMLADILSGYTVYAPATLIIKALMAVVFVLVLKALRSIKINDIIAFSIASVSAELIMATGYLIYEALIIGYGAGALAAVPANVVQGAGGALTGTVLCVFFSKNKAIGRIFDTVTRNKDHARDSKDDARDVDTEQKK